MTKILLETIFLTAFHQLILTCHPLTHPVSSDRPATEPIHGHESVLSHVDGSEGLVRHLLDFYHCATQSGYWYVYLRSVEDMHNINIALWNMKIYCQIKLIAQRLKAMKSECQLQDWWYAI